MGRGEKRVRDNLHAHAQNEPIKNHQKLLCPNHAARVNVSRNALFSSRSGNKNIFFDADTAAISFFSLCHFLFRMHVNVFCHTLHDLFYSLLICSSYRIYLCYPFSVHVTSLYDFFSLSSFVRALLGVFSLSKLIFISVVLYFILTSFRLFSVVYAFASVA